MPICLYREVFIIYSCMFVQNTRRFDNLYRNVEFECSVHIKLFQIEFYIGHCLIKVKFTTGFKIIF